MPLYAEEYRGHTIDGQPTHRGYRITITPPSGPTRQHVYPTLVSDAEARAFAHRAIDAVLGDSAAQGHGRHPPDPPP